MPGKLLRLRGGLGPLQGEAVGGSMTWEMKPAEGGGDGGDGGGESTPATEVTLTYAAHGFLPDGLEAWAGPVDGVVGEALERLGRYVATGDPEASPAGDREPS